MEKKNKITVGLIGNPNVGKSTLFNTLTGARQHIGNWPGKTVDKKTGQCFYQNFIFEIIDLPGSYSLNSFSLEEQITKDFILKVRPDVILQIVDAQNLLRNLYLTTELIDLKVPLILAVNMNQLAKKKGKIINFDKLGKIFDLPVVEIDARKKSTLFLLLKTIILLKKSRHYPHLPLNFSQDKERYLFIKKIADKIVWQTAVKKKGFEDQLDKVLLNKFIGIPLFLIIIWAIFQLTFVLSWPWQKLIVDSLGVLSSQVTRIMTNLGFSPLTISLISQGIIGGVGGILVFIPMIGMLFFFIALLEDSGYLARVAFVMDYLMTKIGLHGKSFLPLIIGFGCNVPALIATRILESKKERLLTILINPFFSCSARLPIYLLFAGVFFPYYQGWVIFGLYLLGIIVGLSSGFFWRRLIIKEKTNELIIELPPYHLPILSHVLIYVWEKVWQFIKKAGSLILAFSLVIWALASFPVGVEYGSKESYFGMIGEAISFIFAPLGFGNWQSAVALLFGLATKEVVVSTFTTLYQNFTLSEAIRQHFTPLSAVSFMVFALLYMPCFSVLATAKKETGSWRWPLIILTYTTVVAWLMSLIIYQGGRLLGFN